MVIINFLLSFFGRAGGFQVHSGRDEIHVPNTNIQLPFNIR